jgi:hypothetical protein
MELTTAKFNALRFWAMNYALIARYRVGVATWPFFRYAPEQEKRLKEIGRAVPTSARMVWLLPFTILWMFLAFLIGFLPLVPLIAYPPRSGQAAGILLVIAIGINLLSSYVLASVAATWLAGRITAPLVLARPRPQEPGDAALLARIKRQIARVAVFGVIAAAVPTLVSFIGQAR